MLKYLKKIYIAHLIENHSKRINHLPKLIYHKYMYSHINPSLLYRYFLIRKIKLWQQPPTTACVFVARCITSLLVYLYFIDLLMIFVENKYLIYKNNKLLICHRRLKL